MRNWAALGGKVTEHNNNNNYNNNNKLFSSKERKEHYVLEGLFTTQLAGRKWLLKSC